MSKASKAATKRRNRVEKDKKKTAKRALYATYAAQGRTKSSKRFASKSKQKREVQTLNHQAGEGAHCGNIGCNRCGIGTIAQPERVQLRRINWWTTSPALRASYGA